MTFLSTKSVRKQKRGKFSKKGHTKKLYCNKHLLSVTHRLILDVCFKTHMHDLHLSTQHLNKTQEPLNWIRVCPYEYLATNTSFILYNIPSPGSPLNRNTEWSSSKSELTSGVNPIKHLTCLYVFGVVIYGLDWYKYLQIMFLVSSYFTI